MCSDRPRLVKSRNTTNGTVQDESAGEPYPVDVTSASMGCKKPPPKAKHGRAFGKSQVAAVELTLRYAVVVRPGGVLKAVSSRQSRNTQSPTNSRCLASLILQPSIPPRFRFRRFAGSSELIPRMKEAPALADDQSLGRHLPMTFYPKSRSRNATFAIELVRGGGDTTWVYTIRVVTGLLAVNPDQPRVIEVVIIHIKIILR
jgi:hypothetical protein